MTSVLPFFVQQNPMLAASIYATGVSLGAISHYASVLGGAGITKISTNKTINHMRIAEIVVEVAASPTNDPATDVTADGFGVGCWLSSWIMFWGSLRNSSNTSTDTLSFSTPSLSNTSLLNVSSVSTNPSNITYSGNLKVLSAIGDISNLGNKTSAILAAPWHEYFCYGTRVWGLVLVVPVLAFVAKHFLFDTLYKYLVTLFKLKRGVVDRPRDKEGEVKEGEDKEEGDKGEQRQPEEELASDN